MNGDPYRGGDVGFLAMSQCPLMAHLSHQE